MSERLRAERHRKGLTVREIAARVGVWPSLISQIERDKVNPSVSTLWALVTVLGLTMGELFADADTPGATPPPPAATGPATAPGTRAVINLESGVHWERLTAGSDPSPTRRAPRPATKTRSFATGAREYGYVISGRLGVRIGFDEYELGPGMAISFDSSSPHRLWAIGDQPAEAIWVVVGRQNPPGAH